MTRKILLIDRVGGIAMASAVAQALATIDPGEHVDIVVVNDALDELLYGFGDPGLDPMGLLREAIVKPLVMPDTREFIPLGRPGKDPNRHRPKDQYHVRKQGWKPRR